MTIGAAIVLQVALTAVAAMGVYWLLRYQRQGFGTLEERATLRTLVFASSTLRTLRSGLSARTASQVLPKVSEQAGATAVALYDSGGLLAFHAGNPAEAESHRLHREAEDGSILEALRGARLRVLVVHPDAPDGCLLRAAVVAPLLVDGDPVAALVTYHLQAPQPAALRIASDLAELLATQLRLQAAEQQRVALARSELRALRAQISPHFIYNTLTTIAAFIRTDPDRARELVTEFAAFTRRAFHGPQTEFTTLADDLIYAHQYLLLEQARLGDRLAVRLHIEPEVLNTAVPVLVVQPLVENAVKHGFECERHTCHIVIQAQDQEDECLIVVRDDGAGFPEEPVPFDSELSTEDPTGALANIDRRLRRTFGPGYGLNIDSRPGQGTSVEVRVPKYRPGVRAS